MSPTLVTIGMTTLHGSSLHKCDAKVRIVVMTIVIVVVTRQISRQSMSRVASPSTGITETVSEK